MENYGYEMIDLGKDVPVEKVVEETKRTGARLVGLSALMTTTVVSMEETIRALHEAGCDWQNMGRRRRADRGLCPSDRSGFLCEGCQTVCGYR